MEKVNSIKKLKGAVITLAIVLGSIIVALSIMLAIFVSKTSTYKLQLENNYKRNFYELVSDINTLEIDMSKLIATNSLSGQQELLTDIYDTTKTSSVNLSTLPIANQKIDNLNNYLNVLGGYSYSLLEKNLNSDEKISDNELQNIEKLYNYCVKIKYDLNNFITDIDDFNIVKLLNYSDGDLSSFDGGLTSVNNNSDEVPTLIYDGPFSDSVTNKEIQGLPSKKYTESEARLKLDDYFKYFDNYQVEYLGDTIGKFATYNYNIKSNDISLYVQITKQGAFLLSINSDYAKGDKNLSVNECEVFAHNFASLMGIEDMYSVWSQEVGDVVYVNLAPIINKTIYYPDLIKVKVHKKAGFVIGWEATNYAYNHVDRENVTPRISFEEAQGLLSSLLTVKERNLCIIPNKYVGESPAYEFVCTWKNYTYYVYLDVETGEELNIMRVVSTTNGDLLM